MARLTLAAVLLLAIALPASASAQVATPPVPPGPLPSPVVRGDWPDPDVTLIDGNLYAVATSGGWAPTFRILRSTDLRGWTIAGSVFRRAPGWAKDSFWAPELAQLPAGGYALFYSAFPRKRPGRTWYCLGVATAPAPLGPWRDLGKPLRCTRRGTIDPTPVVDGAALHLVYKEDGNAFRRPTPILIQQLRADGRALLGEPRELIRNRTAWEGAVVEAPELVQRDGVWHMLYSGNLCCSPRCEYAVGAARAPQLTGPWTRHPGNPILRSGNGWRCPGHVSLIGDRVAFHAYRAGGFLAGRQLHVAPLAFGADGWPAIGDGRPLPPAPGAVPTAFDDRFGGPALASEWEWPVTRPPAVRIAGGLRLRAGRRAGTRADAGLVARRLGSHRYTATAVLRRTALRGDATAGLAVIRGGPFTVGGQAIGVTVGRDHVDTWQRGGHGYTQTQTRIRATAPLVHLRVTADGRRYRFAISTNGSSWVPIGRARRGPVEETARIALTVGGQRRASANFLRATLVER
ncbi:MAG TPA: family 43 glycosylhydrolase [Thermoleophilaceae bacterium]|nr:family 43 glycosylhydrolase [Thermoleophilaceae bacterium]